MSNDFFKMRGIVKQYQMGNEVQTILKGIDLDIEEGEFLSILGPSGSGKSTLMNIIGCLDTPKTSWRISAARKSALSFSSFSFCRGSTRSRTWNCR